MFTFPYENLSYLENRLTLFLRIKNKRCILENSFSVGILFISFTLIFKREFPCLQAGDDSVSFRLSFGLQYIFLLFLPIYDQRTLQNRILSRGMVTTTQPWKFVPQADGWISLQLIDHKMNGIGRLASDKKVNMIGHNFHIFYSYSQFICLRRQKGFQSFIDSVYQHLSSVFRAEDNVIP